MAILPGSWNLSYFFSLSNHSIVPEEALSRPAIILNRVVFPEPFGPKIAHAPSSMSKETPAKIVFDPKDFDRLLATIRITKDYRSVAK